VSLISLFLQSPREDSPERNKPYFRYGGDHGTNFMLEDLRTVEEDSWLTDNVISFWESHLETLYLSHSPRARIKLVRPIEAVLLARGLTQNVDPDWNYTHLFLPINPSGGEFAEEGTHWSLLVISLVDGVAFHYNSMVDHPHVADEITQNLGRLIGKPLRFLDMDHVPQQSNSRDCGVYVCMFMEELLANRLLVIDGTQKITMSLKGNKISAKKGRKKIWDAAVEERTMAMVHHQDGLLMEDKHGNWY
jgi:sentrin-specific protease 8